MKHKVLSRNDERELFGFISGDLFIQWLRAGCKDRRNKANIRSLGMLFVFTQAGKVEWARMLRNETADRVLGRYPFHQNSVLVLDLDTVEGMMILVWLGSFHDLAQRVRVPNSEGRRAAMGDEYRWIIANAESFLENRFFARGTTFSPARRRLRRNRRKQSI